MSNPFAYYEEKPSADLDKIGFGTSIDPNEGILYEPRVPVQLRLKRGIFRKTFLLEVIGDQCVISGDSSPDSIIIPRSDAPNRIRIKSSKLTVSIENGRKKSFRFRRCVNCDLASARLETWAKQRWDSAPGPAYESVWGQLKRNTIYPVLHSMIFLTILQGLLVLLTISASVASRDFLLGFWYLAVVGVLGGMGSLFLSVILWMRQIWGLYVTIVLSFFPMMPGIAILFIPHIGIDGYVVAAFIVLVPAAVIGTCIMAIVRYHRQHGQLRRDNL